MNNLFQKYKTVADKFIPSLKSNNFLKTGMLTKDEFIEAGNYLYPITMNGVGVNQIIIYHLI